ncbi:MAG: hypothetical protein F6J96_31415 [Symploca sp. SIO1C2]|nr:hypothetical protein [Symploca sp. SIO1C2]
MSSQNSLDEQEFKKLVELLSTRKDELEGRITIDSVRVSLAELGLSELLVDNDIEEVRKQVNREFRRRQLKSYTIFGIILTILIAPLAAYGGFKFKELLINNFTTPETSAEVASSSELVKLEGELAELRDDKAKLEQQLKESEAEKDNLAQQIEALENESEAQKKSIKPDLPAPTPTSNAPSETVSTSPQPVERQDIVFELQNCQKSNTSTTSQTIECSFLITSNRENAKVYLYSNQSNTRRSRVVEAGQEYIANRSELGSARNKYKVENTLIKDTAMGAKLFFDEVPLTVNSLEVIEISSYLESSYYNDDIKLEFRNIPLSE